MNTFNEVKVRQYRVLSSLHKNNEELMPIFHSLYAAFSVNIGHLNFSLANNFQSLYIMERLTQSW